MSGTFPGISGACQQDTNGRPLRNGFLYVFDATTNAPVLTFQDIGLALPAANPLSLDAAGRVPLFFVNDGTYRTRLTDADGVVAVDWLQVPSIGASTSGGGGSAVDPTTVAGTGDIKWLPIDGVIAGWVRTNGKTIGSALSGASERANADCSALFIWLWTNFSDSKCPVLGGRGGSGLADFNAGKQITLLDFRDSTLVGLDSMGNAAKGGLLSTNVTSGGGDGVNTPAASGGEANHTLTTAELAAHSHTVTDAGHTHAVGFASLAPGGGTGAVVDNVPGSSGNKTSGNSTTGITIDNSGGGSAHNNCQPFVLGTWFVKL